jgi:low temperature requirement protein LtrA
MLRNILVHSHSGLRWILILAFLFTLVMLFRAAFGGKGVHAAARKSALFTMIVTHVQLIIGLVLYFISPLVMFSSASMKNHVLRFYLVEHISLMLIAIALVTIGYSVGKKAVDPVAGSRKTFVYYLFGFLLILVSIPWPFRNLGAGWF